MTARYTKPKNGLHQHENIRNITVRKSLVLLPADKAAYIIRHYTGHRALSELRQDERYRTVTLIITGGAGFIGSNFIFYIVKMICRELGKPESLIQYVKDRKGHDLRYAIDPTKIYSELG